jgi:hypothetical protein
MNFALNRAILSTVRPSHFDSQKFQVECSGTSVFQEALEIAAPVNIVFIESTQIKIGTFRIVTVKMDIDD